jgi:hypothetical protein
MWCIRRALPAEEIAAAVKQINAKAVALSLCYRETDSRVLEELSRLRHLSTTTSPFSSGAKRPAYARAPGRERNHLSRDLSEFRSALQIIVAPELLC